MEKKAVSEELNSIFSLFRACIDKNHLNSLIEERGLSNRVAFKKEADEHIDNFGRVFSALIKEGADDSTLFNVIEDYRDSFETKISKKVRPVSDPTQEKVIQRQMEKIHLEDEDHVKQEVKSLNIWDRAIRELLATSFGNEGKGKWKDSAEINGKKIKDVLYDSKNIPVLSLNSLKKGFNNVALSMIKASPGHMDKSDVRDWMMMYVFIPGAISKKLEEQAEEDGLKLNWSSKKPVTYNIGKKLETLDQDELPLDITPMINQHLSSAWKDFQKFVTKKELPNQEKLEQNYKDLKEELATLKNNEEGSEGKNKEKLKKDIAEKQKDLASLEKKIKKLPADGLEHQKKDDEDDSMPDISNVKDPIDLINKHILTPELKKNFSKYVNRKGAPKDKELVDYLLSGESSKSLEDKGGIQYLMKKIKITNPTEFKKVINSITKHLADYALKEDLPKLWSGLKSRGKLPKGYENMKISSIENRVASVVDYLEALAGKV